MPNWGMVLATTDAALQTLRAAGTTGSVKNVLSSSPYTNSSTHIQFQSIGPQNYLQHNSFVACLKSFYT